MAPDYITTSNPLCQALFSHFFKIFLTYFFNTISCGQAGVKLLFFKTKYRVVTRFVPFYETLFVLIHIYIMYIKARLPNDRRAFYHFSVFSEIIYRGLDLVSR